MDSFTCCHSSVAVSLCHSWSIYFGMCCWKFMNIAYCLSNAFWLEFLGKSTKKYQRRSRPTHTYPHVDIVLLLYAIFGELYNAVCISNLKCPRFFRWQWIWSAFLFNGRNFIRPPSACLFYLFHLYLWICVYVSSFHYYGPVLAIVYVCLCVCVCRCPSTPLTFLSEHDFKMLKCRTLKAIYPFDKCRDTFKMLKRKKCSFRLSSSSSLRFPVWHLRGRKSESAKSNKML